MGIDTLFTPRLIAAVAITAVIVALTVVLSPSLSIGGVIYGEDPEACASCHYEKQFYEGWRLSTHGKSDVTCGDCHSPPLVDRLAAENFTREGSCIVCHSSKEELLNATRFYGYWPIPARIVIEVNPHNKLDHFANVPCATCHIEHKAEKGVRKMVSENPCVRCHNVAPPPERP